MADDSDKILPSPPPKEPFDVSINPDPPPAAPFDVQVTLDPPPAEPFDVAVTPSPPPGQPFDVPIYPDGPPWAPVDVGTNPSSPPAVPFDVATYPDSPPALPFDVPTVPSPGPAVPFNVATSPSPPPALPFNVQTTPDPPPATPFNVAISLDPAPALPFDVSVQPSPPPAEPFDVATYPSPPALDLGGGSSGKPTIDGIIRAVGSFDARLSAFFGAILEIEPISVAGGFAALDPTALARWFKDYVSSVGPAKVAQFTAEQAVLYAMNPLVARVFNPGYFAAMLVPGSMGNFHTTIDTQAGLTADVIIEGQDKLRQGLVSADPRRPGGGPEDAFGPSNTFLDGADFTIDELVSHAIDGNPHVFLKEGESGGGAGTVQRFDASSYFEDRRNGAMLTRASVRARAAAGTAAYDEGLRRSAALDGVIRVSVGQWDVDGVVYSSTPNPANVVDDNEARVPLCFTDLRHDPVNNGYRSVFFRPLNLNFGRSLSPEWGDSRSFGRTDPNVAYIGTSKTINVAWEVHAFAPEDLRVMYNKLTALESMCYPTYGADSLIRSGPVARLRIGDAVGNEQGGMPGIIRSLSTDFSDAIWELRRGSKVPMSFKVSVDFQVLHDGPVGILDGQFGVLKLPPAIREDADSSRAGSTDRQTGPSETARIAPGLYSKFGERRR